MDMTRENFNNWYSIVQGKSLAELKDEGIYKSVQEQGQERTWFDCNGFDFNEMERRNKDIKDEIFVGHLPRDAKATDLFETFSACGLIREIRMMFEFSNQNRGFCFISYMDEVNASRAVQDIKGSRLIHKNFGKFGEKDEVHVELSRKQKRLFLGGVGKDHDEETIKDEVRRALKRSSEFCDSICTPTIEIVEVIKRSDWGYCFIDFKNHKQAALAKRIGIRDLFEGKEKVTLDWAKDKDSIKPEDEVKQLPILQMQNGRRASSGSVLQPSMSNIYPSTHDIYSRADCRRASEPLLPYSDTRSIGSGGNSALPSPGISGLEIGGSSFFFSRHNPLQPNKPIIMLEKKIRDLKTKKEQKMYHLDQLHAEYVQKKLCLEQEIQSLLKESQFEEMKLDNEVQMAEIRREIERNGSETSLNEQHVWRQEQCQPEPSRGNEHHHRVREIDSDSIPWPPQIITNEQKSINYENLKWNPLNLN